MATSSDDHDHEWSHKTWIKGSYLISTDHTLLPLAGVNEAFASNEMHWASALPEAILERTLKNSLCYGLYERVTTVDVSDEYRDSQPVQSTLTFIGLGRCITDYTTFLYLTDVWVSSAKQGQGLGKWLIGCIKETVDAMPHLRRTMLLTGDWERSVPFYEKVLGAELMHGKSSGKDDTSGQSHLAVLTRTGQGYVH